MFPNRLKFIALLVVASFVPACATETDTEESTGEEALPATAQFIQLRDSQGRRYELPYEADLSPAQAAAVISVKLQTSTGKKIELTPVDSATAEDVPAMTPDNFRVWSPRLVDDENEPGYDEQSVLVNSIQGFEACWTSQTIASVGAYKVYTMTSGIGGDAFMVPSNTVVDFDLFQYASNTLVDSSIGGPGIVDHTGAYSPSATNKSWSFRVQRANSSSGSYAICAKSYHAY
jgi:hypothetical protein